MNCRCTTIDYKMYFAEAPLNMQEYIQYYRNGNHTLRGEDFSQPRALTRGDVLSNGLKVSANPIVGFDGSIGLRFTNGLSRYVDPRLPLQLESKKNGVLPKALRVGHILQTGCVVLDAPKPIGITYPSIDQKGVRIVVTGEVTGDVVRAPADLELAVFEQEYPPSPDTLLGAFALERVYAMDEIARSNLLERDQMALQV